MANQQLFSSNIQKVLPANAVNEAGGPSYVPRSEVALAMLACTGTFNNTFYTTGADQLQKMYELAQQSSPQWVARVAIYARNSGLMKDAPAFLVAYLFSLEDKAMFKAAFPKVIDNIGQLRSFTQIVRSGVTGRTSLGTSGKKAIASMLNGMEPSRIFWQSYGTNPSLSDILSLAHPRPATAEHDALFGYLKGRPYIFENLPKSIQHFEMFKAGDSIEVPAVPFLRLTALELSVEQWQQVTRTMTWNQLRMNLNNLTKKGVFSGPAGQELIQFVANRIKDERAVTGSRILPFALYNAFLNLNSEVPGPIRNAVSIALELSATNAPVLPGKTLILVDSSGSMGSPVTGHRRGATSTMSCNQAASYFAAALMKANPDNVDIVAFDTEVHQRKFNPMDSLSSIASAVGLNGGGTDCGCGIKWATTQGANWDNILMISDNESWVRPNNYGGYYRPGTNTAFAWDRYKKAQPQAKLFCIDIAPYDSNVVPSTPDTLNVSGLSDAVFKVVNIFAGTNGAASWEKILSTISLD